MSGGVRLFERFAGERMKLEPRRAIASPLVTHLYYDVA